MGSKCAGGYETVGGGGVDRESSRLFVGGIGSGTALPCSCFWGEGSIISPRGRRPHLSMHGRGFFVEWSASSWGGVIASTHPRLVALCLLY